MYVQWVRCPRTFSAKNALHPNEDWFFARFLPLPFLSFLHFLQRQSLPVLFEQLLIDLGGDLVQVKDPQGPFHQTPGLGPVTCVLSEGVSVLLILLPLVLWSTISCDLFLSVGLRFASCVFLCNILLAEGLASRSSEIERRSKIAHSTRNSHTFDNFTNSGGNLQSWWVVKRVEAEILGVLKGVPVPYFGFLRPTRGVHGRLVATSISMPSPSDSLDVGRPLRQLGLPPQSNVAVFWACRTCPEKMPRPVHLSW